MKFNPEKYRIPDERMKPFIDVEEIQELLLNAKPDKSTVRDPSLPNHWINTG